MPQKRAPKLVDRSGGRTAASVTLPPFSVDMSGPLVPSSRGTVQPPWHGSPFDIVPVPASAGQSSGQANTHPTFPGCLLSVEKPDPAAVRGVCLEIGIG